MRTKSKINSIANSQLSHLYSVQRHHFFPLTSNTITQSLVSEYLSEVGESKENILLPLAPDPPQPHAHLKGSGSLLPAVFSGSLLGASS